MESNLPVTAKIKIAKCSCNTLNHETAKILNSENFPSYGIHQTKTRCNSRPLHNPHLHFRLVKKFHFSQTKHYVVMKLTSICLFRLSQKALAFHGHKPRVNQLIHYSPGAIEVVVNACLQLYSLYLICTCQCRQAPGLSFRGIGICPFVDADFYLPPLEI